MYISIFSVVSSNGHDMKTESVSTRMLEMITMETATVTKEMPIQRLIMIRFPVTSSNELGCQPILHNINIIISRTAQGHL